MSAGLTTEMQCLARDRVTADVVLALRAAGVRPILLKGASYKPWLYVDGTSRAYRDTDLLVDPDLIGLAESVLSGLGFHHEPLDDLPFDKPWHGHEWIRRHDGSAVDLHRTLIGVEEPPTVVWRVLSGSTERLVVGGVSVEVLDEARRALHVALHAAQDGGRKRRSTDDLERAVALVTEQTWLAAKEVAGRLRATHAMAAGLRLSQDGGRLAEALGLPDDLPPAVLLRARGAPPEAVALQWLLQQRPADRVGFAVTKLFPPPAFMRAWSPHARRGRAGLGASYVLRVISLLGRLPLAVRSLVRCRGRTACR